MSRAFEGAAAGAATGTMIGGPGWGTAIGAGVGLIGGLFKGAAEEEDERKRASIKAIQSQMNAQAKTTQEQRSNFASLMDEYGRLLG